MQVKVKIIDIDPVIRAYWRQQPRKVDMAIARAMTQVGFEARRELTSKEGLRKYPRHDPQKVRTTSPKKGPDNPPSQASGKLASTVYVGPSQRKGFGVYEKSVGPTMFYARVQDEGQVIQAKTPYGMRFIYGGVGYSHVQKVTIPKREYLAPARNRLEQRGKIERIFAAEFAKAFANPPSSSNTP